MTATIKLPDDEVLMAEDVNGDSFLFEKEITYDKFDDDMTIRIEYEDGAIREMQHAYVAMNGKLAIDDGWYHLAFAEHSTYELKDMRIKELEDCILELAGVVYA